jgi:transposase
MEPFMIDEQLDEKTKSLLSRLQLKDEKLKSKDEELESKEIEIQQLKNELDILKGQILNKNRKLFGQSSEQVAYSQLSVFDEAEKFSDEKAVEPTIEEITYTRNKKTTTGKKENYDHLEKVVIEHKLEGDDLNCDLCQTPRQEIGYTSKEILKYEPAKLYIEEHRKYSYNCVTCEKETDQANIITTEAPKTLLHKSMASNELVAHTIVLKYRHALPLYRQEQYFKMMGARLSRQTLSNWVISAAKELDVVYQLMIQELLKRDYVQADETPVKVIDEKGMAAKGNKYMWLYKSGNQDKPVIIYDYQKTRSSNCPKKFLSEFSGTLQTDGYAGYNAVSNINRLYCLAHIRRKFHDIVVTLDEEALKISRAVIGFNYCEQLYHVEKSIREEHKGTVDYYKNRQIIRNEKTKPILLAFKEYLKTELPKALPRSPLGKALGYAEKLLPSFDLILDNGALEIDNNGAERSIKPFVIGRKNWLFSSSKKGALASATLYSLIETAKANGLIVEKYLVYIMDKVANRDSLQDTNDLHEHMPWSDNLPPYIKDFK